MERDLKSVLGSFEKAKEWEWSDLIRWIMRVQTIVESFPGDSFQDALTLEKRLWQCLNPALPQGLHSLTLKIYETILQKPNLPSQDFVLFLTGVLPYFQYSSSENRLQVISMLNNTFKHRIKELKLILQGVVISLLPGLDQDSNQDVGRKTFDILDEFALKLNSRDLFYCVWKGMLTTPRVRLGAITYLKERIQQNDEEGIEFSMPSKVLVVNALRSALGDNEVLVRRNCMDLLIEHFPIQISEDIITFKEKILIIEEVLKLFLKEDNHTIRRIWKWMLENPENDFPYLTELLIEALKDIMSCEKFQKHEQITIYKTLLEQKTLVEPLMRELSVPFLIFTEKLKEDAKTLGKCIQLLKSKPCTENEELIWEGLNYYFEENLHGDLSQSISIISLYFTSISSNFKYAKALFENILMSLHNLGEKQLIVILNLAIEMVNRFEHNESIQMQDAVKSFQEFFINLIDEDFFNLDQFSRAAQLSVILHKFAPADKDLKWLTCLTSLENIHSSMRLSESSISFSGSDSEYFLVKCGSLIELLKTGSGPIKDSLEQSKTHKRLFERLWDLLGKEDLSPEALSKSVRFLMQLEQISHEKLIKVFQKKLENKQCRREELIGNIRVLVKVWKNLQSKEDLIRIFGKRKIVNQMITHLSSNDPLVSFASVQWLMTVIDDLDVILEPILLEIIENVREDQLKELEKNLHDLKCVLVKGSTKCISQCDYIQGNLELVDAFEELFADHLDSINLTLFENSGNFEKQNSLLQILLKIPFIILLKQWTTNNFEQILEVKVSACDFLSILFTKPDSQIAYFSARAVLVSLSKIQDSLNKEIFEDSGELLHYHLLNIINVVFFDCNIRKDEEQYTNLVQSDIFLKVYIEGLRVNKGFILARWAEFITESFPIISCLSKKRGQNEKIDKLGSDLIQELCCQLKSSEDKSYLKKALKEVIHCVFIHFPKNTDSYAKDQLCFVITSLLSSLKTFHTTLTVKTTGTKYVNDKDIKDLKDAEDVVEILKPILNKDSNRTVKSFFEVWLVFCAEENPNEETNEKLKKLLGLIITLKSGITPLLTGLIYAAYKLNKGEFFTPNEKDPLKKQEINKLCHFIYSLLCVFPSSEMNENSACSLLVDLCKELEKSELEVVKLWILDIIKLLLDKTVTLIKDKSYFRTLYEYVQRTLVAVTRYSLSTNNEKLLHPVPASIFEYQVEHRLNSGSLISIKSTLTSIVLNLWKGETQEKIISQFSSSTSLMIEAIITRPETIEIQLTSELLAQVLTTGRVWLAKTYRKEIIDFFTSPKFFKAFVVGEGRSAKYEILALKEWSKIVSCVSNECYGDRYSLITELFNKMYTGIISRGTNNVLRAQSLKTVSFVVYSGAVDEYQCCTQMICEKLIEFIKIDDENLKKSVYHCTIVLLLRLSSEALNNLWPRLWPHLFTDIWQIVTDPATKDNIKGKKKSISSVLDLLDILITLMNQDFQIFKPMLFYDNVRAYQESLKEDTSDGLSFKPLLELINGFTKLMQEAGEEDEQYKTVIRNLIIDDAIQEDHISYKIRKMLRDSMRKSESIFIPSLDTIEKLIEKKFFN